MSPLSWDFASWDNLTYNGYYGAFIASMYAAIGGFSLEHHSEQVGTYLDEWQSGIKEGNLSIILLCQIQKHHL